MIVPAGVTLVVGLGISGRAIARHLARKGTPFMVADTRPSPPGLDDFHAAHPGIDVHCGPLTALDLSQAKEVVLSPGIDPKTQGLEALWKRTLAASGELKKAELKIVGEIALFVRECRAPIAAITGANAKSTVTTLLGEMAREAGHRVAIGGNLGTPALDLLAEQSDAELFVLELSSFQLETTPCLGAETAAFLNLCEDHLDRHGDMAGYRDAKLGIFRGARHAVASRDDPLTWPADPSLPVAYFTAQPPQAGEWGIDDHQTSHGTEPWLMHGEVPLMAADEVRLPGRHNQTNALAALAMGTHLGLEFAAMRRVLARFSGLPHRGELIGERGGVRWINDSKGTNVGATLAAIAGLGATLQGRLIWLGGGLGKGADFTPLVAPLVEHTREAIVFGADAPRLMTTLGGQLPVTRTQDMQGALERAATIAEPGDCVLLSPACASFDQFPNYQVRGDNFRDWVKRYLAADNRENT